MLLRSAALTFVVAAVGCMRTTPALEDVQPTAGGDFDDQNEAVIVIGHRVTGEAEPEVSISDMEMTWAQYDPEYDRLIFSKPKRRETLVSIMAAPADAEAEADADGMIDGRYYSARMVQPGCYILHTTRARSMSPLTELFGPTYISNVTVFAGSVESTGRRSHRPVAGSGAPAFCVEGGEVAYIGDFLFDASSRPARLLEHGNSFGAARRFMDESYPEYAEALVSREVVFE